MPFAYRSLDELSIDADLVIETRDQPVHVSASGKDVLVEFPSLATGLEVLRSALPRDIRLSILETTARCGVNLRVVVGGRTVAEANRRFFFLRRVGWPHTRLRPFSLLLVALGM